MAKPSYIVVPQRSDGVGYVDCPIHRATSFAVKKIEKRKVQSKTYTISAVLSRHSTKTQAEGDRLSHERSTLGRMRDYALGCRMPKQETTI